MKKIFIYSLVLFTMLSCRIRGNFNGLYSDNHKYTDSYVLNNCSENDNSKILLINGQQLLNCLQVNNKASLVYIWDLNCKSDNCVNINYFLNFCKSKNIQPYIIIEYLVEKDLNYYKSLNTKLYSIDNKYYKTNLVSSYVNKFMNDITLTKPPIEDRYIYFKDNKTRTSSGINNLFKIDTFSAEKL